MYESVHFLTHRKDIPADLANRLVTPLVNRSSGLRIDVLDAVGTSLLRPGWQRILAALPAGAALNVLLLDPDGAAVRTGAADPALWWTDPDEIRAKIRQVAAGLADSCRQYGITLSLRFYDRIPVSRYVATETVVYQSRYPGHEESTPVPVAVLSPETVLGRRAHREFTTLWAASAGSPPALSPFHFSPSSPSPSLPSSLRLVENRKAVPDDLARHADPAFREVDVIDVAGAAQVGSKWRALLDAPRTHPVRMRILLLDPDGTSVVDRARESTRWQGDHEGMRSRIRRNLGLLHAAAAELGAGVDLRVRLYDELPVSRYVRVDETVYQSYYPSGESAKDVPLAVLGAADMLGQRAMRDFDAVWRYRSRPAGTPSEQASDVMGSAWQR
jgi:hypothetical protein